MKSLLDKEDFNIDDVQTLIDSEAEESLYLDFKEAGALDRSDSKKKEISKDVAAFANSDGGIIIYGIKEEDHKANELSFINGDAFSKEWLEQVITSGISRQIKGLKIFPIRDQLKIERTIYVVQIPKSLDAPHMSRDNKFYKRHNFESVAMAEYEVRELYGRKLLSKLIIGGIGIKMKEKGTDETKFELSCTIINDGDVAETLYKLNFYFDKFTHLGVSWEANKLHYDHTPLNEGKVKVSATGNQHIFPGEEICAIRFNLLVSNQYFREAIEDVNVEARILFSQGEDTYKSSLKGLVNLVIEQAGYKKLE